MSSQHEYRFFSLACRLASTDSQLRDVDTEFQMLMAYTIS